MSIEIPLQCLIIFTPLVTLLRGKYGNCDYMELFGGGNNINFMFDCIPLVPSHQLILESSGYMKLCMSPCCIHPTSHITTEHLLNTDELPHSSHPGTPPLNTIVTTYSDHGGSLHPTKQVAVGEQQLGAPATPGQELTQLSYLDLSFLLTQ